MIRLTKDTDHVATITLDMAGHSDNLLNHAVVDAFQPVLAHLQKEKARGALRGVIVRSAKKTFLSGGELEYLRSNRGSEEVFRLTERLKRLLRELEHPGVPVVAALNGSAIGIGFEFALACHHRVALDKPQISFGLPEINLGLMPGAGACVRLLWLLGLELAHPLLTSGRNYTPAEALANGLVDELVADEAELLERARAFVLSTEHGSRPWDRGEGIPGGNAHDPDVRRYVVAATAGIARDHRRHYPAYAAILSTLSEGSKVDFDTALRIETRKYTELLTEPTARNMINAFWFERHELTRGTNRPRGFGRFRPKTVGVIGAGTMGSGIGYACARAGLSVIIKDVSRAIALKGRELAGKSAEAQVEAGTLSADQSAKLLERLSFTERSSDFEDCDLVIEAVFENENVKRKVIREAGQHLDEYALLASNTLSIPITRLAERSYHPDQFVGIHFFPPADSVPLVEIVRGAETSDETVARAYDFARAIRKVPIVVKDSWGFYVARVQNTYILEGVSMLLDGYAPALIDNLGRQLGFPLGPLALADKLGLGLVLNYEGQASEHYGDRYERNPAVTALEVLVEAGRGGRAQGGGFYDVPAGPTDPPVPWEELSERFPAYHEGYDRAGLEQRLLFAQVAEAGWCLHEEVVTLVAEANLGSIYGWGFPANFGGVIQYARQYGGEAFLARAEELREAHGPRFTVCDTLERLVAEEAAVAQELAGV